MSDITVEKKLELIQQVRSQQYRNQSDMINREQILYGKTYSYRPEFYSAGNIADNTEGIFKDNTLKIRYALAAVLFVTIIIFDRTGHTIAGVSMDKIFSLVETDYEESLDAWISTNAGQ